MSIIIAAYNAEKTLSACLSACMAQQYSDFEVIVVDDGSTDSTSSIAGSFESVLYHSQQNAGPASARNAGARLARGEILAYTDADCIPRPDWIRRLCEGFSTGNVSAVGGTYSIANPEHRLARGIQAEIALRHRQFNDKVDFLGSFNVAYRRSAFEATGGFDESYRQASGEDNDLAYRIHDQGGTMIFTPEAVVAHYHPERVLHYLRTQARHGFWRVKLYREHPRRASGDQYAGWPDLLAPPMALALPVLLMLFASVGAVLGVTRLSYCLNVGLILFYAVLHAPLAYRLRETLSSGDLLYFLMVACLRDFARAAGLLKGLCTFSSRKGSRA